MATKSKVLNELNPLYCFIGSEKDIENHILDNIDLISHKTGWGKIKRVEKQYMISFGKGRIICDIMIWHEDGTGTVIEVKQVRTNRNNILSAIGQLLSYKFKLKEKLKKAPRLVLAANEINTELYHIIKENNLDINLLMLDGDRIIYLS